MTTGFHIVSDNGNGHEREYMNIIAQNLRACGHSCSVGKVGSNQEGWAHNYDKSKTLIFMCNGLAPATIWSFKNAIKAGSIPKTIFLLASWMNGKSSSPMRSEQKSLSYAFVPEWDATQFMTSASRAAMERDRKKTGGTVGSFVLANAQYVGLVWASSPEDAAKRICNNQITGLGTSGLGSGSSSSSAYTGTLQGNSDSNISPLLQGEMTFQELVGEICNGIDLLFLCKRSVVVVTDFESIFAEAKYLRDNHYSAISSEDIKLWQLEEDTYELNINQHGFYNTVYVIYKNGVVKETFNDFVRVFGEVSITYTDKKIDKTTAKMKAKAYLAAHLRDLEMTVEASILSEPDIDIGDIVTLENPKIKQNNIKTSQGGDPEFLFVKGVNTSWEGDGYIESDLELQFSPTSPSKKEVPTTGTTGTTNNTANE